MQGLGLKRQWIWLSVLALIAVAVSPLMAQTYRGSIYVQVNAEDNRPAVGAIVSLVGTDFVRTAQSDERGRVRFIGLEPGTYSIKIEQAGYNTVIQEKVRVEVQSNFTLTFGLTRSEIVEEVTVTSETPLLDRRKTGTSTVLDLTDLEQVPTARDPWSVLSMIPGITQDRVNVGGSESGQQSIFVGRGDDGDGATWTLDGVDFTDMAAVGATSTYMDFNSFAQVGYATSAVDFEQVTPGLQMNFVAKQGANRTTGTMRMLWADENWQSANQPQEAKDAGLSAVSVNETFERNFDIGGALVSDQLWYWVGVGKNDIDLITINGNQDRTILENISGKVHGSYNDARLNFKLFYTNGDKIKNGRTWWGGGHDANSVLDQEGPTPIYSAEVSSFLTPDLNLQLQLNKIQGGFKLTPKGAGQLIINQDFVAVNSGFILDGSRPTTQQALRGEYFVSTGSVDHELHFGVKRKQSKIAELFKYGGDVFGFEPIGLFWSYRESNVAGMQDIYQAWIGDTMLAGPWTITAGLSYVRASGKQTASTVSAAALTPDLLPSATFEGYDPGFTWSDLLPRIGASYQIEGDRTILLRASYARYADQLSLGTVGFNNPVDNSSVLFFWDDLDGNDQIDDGEWDPNQPLAFGNIDPNDPTSIVAVHQIDRNLTAPLTDELILGAEYEIAPNFTLAGNLIYRKKTNTTWAPLIGVDMADYELYDTVTGEYNGTAYSEPVYALADTSGTDLSRARILTNRRGYSEIYKGFELVATKRLSNRWQARGFIAYTDWTRNFSGTAGIQDPTNFEGGTLDDGGLVAVQSGGSGGKGNVWLGTSKWQFNLNGVYQIPWGGLSLSGNLQGRQGFALPVYHDVTVEDADGNRVSKSVQIGAVDAVRADNVYVLDLKLAKNFRMRDTNVEVSVEAFNVTNSSAVLQRLRQANDANYNRIAEYISPRIFRFGATITF